MSFIQLVVVLVAIGLAMWLINTYIPLQGTIRGILNVVVVILVILFVLSAFGIVGIFPGIRILR